MQVSQRTLKLAFLFVASYIGLYFGYQLLRSLAQVPLHNWQFTGSFAVLDYMFFLMPVAGFFVIYMIVDWIDEYYKTGFAHTPLFPALFFALSLAAYYVALYWYFSNLADLGDPNAMNFDYVSLFLDSAFLLFVLAGLLGWVSHLVMARVSGEAQAGGKPKKPARQTASS